MARNVLPSVKMVLVPLVGSCFSTLRGILIERNPRPRVHTDVIVIALDNNLINRTIAVSLVMSMPVVIVMMMMVSMVLVPWFG